MLVEAIQKAQGTLDGVTAQTAEQIVLSNLRDPDVGVRTSSVLALAKEADMIPEAFSKSARLVSYAADVKFVPDLCTGGVDFGLETPFEARLS
jgi:hypothetical protein